MGLVPVCFFLGQLALVGMPSVTESRYTSVPANTTEFAFNIWFFMRVSSCPCLFRVMKLNAIDQTT